MTTSYHIAIDGVQSGPHDEAEVRRRIASGDLKPADLCWQNGWPAWVPVAQAFPAPAVTPPPLPTGGASDTPRASDPARRPAPAYTAYVAAPPPGPAETSGLAIASLILGLLGLVTFFLAIPAVICGHIAHSNIKRSKGALGGGGMALAGIIMGYVMIVMIPLLTAMAIPAFNKVRTASEQKAIMNNLRQLGAAADQYMLENGRSFATYQDMVGPGKYIPEIRPIAGETYEQIVVRMEKPEMVVRTRDGVEVRYGQ